jgi:hypothetical protein
MIIALILFGLALFILRSQLLRVGMQMAAGGAGGMDMAKVHASPLMGNISGMLALGAAGSLVILALQASGTVNGLLITVGGIMAGIVLAATLIPLLGTTLMFGHHGGEGMVSVAAFNRAYGAYVALSVAVLAGFAWALHLGLRI